MNGWTECLVTIERPVESIDTASGTEVTTWEPLVALAGSPVIAEKFWARFRDVRPGRAERTSNELSVARNQAELRIRWRADVVSNMRVTVHRGADVVYAIIGGPAEVGGRRREIELLIERSTS